MDFKRSLRETVEEYGLMAKKSLGQNFLLDQNITDKIIRSSLMMQGLESFAGRSVVEVGPGPGGVTRAILKNLPQKLTVIEMDERCIEIMRQLRLESGVDIEIINEDALKINLFEQNSGLVQIVSNLPYNVSVPLLLGWLKHMHYLEAMTLMFQKEVAQRIMAPLKSKDYGRLSVMAQLVCRIDKLFDLNPECFVPAPKIWSTVLLFRPLNVLPDPEILNVVEHLTSLAFGQRRKMIRQSLKSVPNLEEICREAGVNLTQRAEEISPRQYYVMAEKYFCQKSLRPL